VQKEAAFVLGQLGGEAERCAAIAEQLGAELRGRGNGLFSDEDSNDTLVSALVTLVEEEVKEEEAAGEEKFSPQWKAMAAGILCEFCPMEGMDAAEEVIAALVSRIRPPAALSMKDRVREAIARKQGGRASAAKVPARRMEDSASGAFPEFALEEGQSMREVSSGGAQDVASLFKNLISSLDTQNSINRELQTQRIRPEVGGVGNMPHPVDSVMQLPDGMCVALVETYGRNVDGWLAKKQFSLNGVWKNEMQAQQLCQSATLGEGQSLLVSSFRFIISQVPSAAIALAMVMNTNSRNEDEEVKQERMTLARAEVTRPAADRTEPLLLHAWLAVVQEARGVATVEEQEMVSKLREPASVGRKGRKREDQCAVPASHKLGKG
jgi:hypothetical protein